ncbi:LysM peptidoglycan-binding domain-containing protein [Solitalea sp. MAHUQ-68]|uniref:LysM peptidoglycan-binding domain-containing protein n=1 Tax=Solitalea agri TaxID=2953739 RepID=A0A9X2F5Z9_9SPHI|nr:LysM peptidoglycan-binding domain-containing protein [Solitalea agri]MCO4294785.1 LysM peptidoglycan-binding domain-containing protein [Solitalea agri]
MKRLGILLLSLLGIVAIAKASTVDSLGVGEYKGKPVILHLIESKENYYSISRKYHVSPSELMTFNDNAPIRIGDTLKVYKKNLSLKKGTSAAVASTGKAIEHTVVTGETMFSISRKYNVSVEDILTWNNLKDNSAKIGQKLKIIPGTKASAAIPAATLPATKPAEQVVKIEKQEEVKVVPKPVTVKTETTEDPKTDTAESTAEATTANTPVKVSGREVHESGMATWISDNDLNQAKSVALHRSAPIGTIIKITNPMSNKSVYVKVVGNFPESADTKNVLIVISKSAANLLGVRDQKFRIDLSYAL